jgi:GNAT superfamily N-acetyltransferase
MDGIRYLKLRGRNSDPKCERLLAAAFSIPLYTENFPHIFHPLSSADLFAGLDAADRLVAMCAVDTEIWTEPRFLRGACIGSVAVDPQFQRRGLGQQLLKWVVGYLEEERRHDFIYLFSDQPRFYESLGFRQRGTERLFSPKADAAIEMTGHFIFRPPVFVAQLSENQKIKLWQGLECGRFSGESHAAWSKFQLTLQIPEMLVSWIENNEEEIFAGAFVGKGVDFRGVVHSFFARDDLSLQAFWNAFLLHLKQTGSQVLAAPGLWAEGLENSLVESARQSLCLVSENHSGRNSVGELIDAQKLYPRALFSS